MATKWYKSADDRRYKAPIYRPSTDELELEPDPDTGSIADDPRAARVAEYSLESIFIGLFGASLLLITIVTVIFTMLIPITMNSVGLVAFTEINHKWRHDYGKLDTEHEIDQFVSRVNAWENTFNLGLISLQFVIILWDYCLGIIYFLFELFINLAVFCFKAILAPLFQPVIRPVLTWMMQALETIMQALSEGDFGSGAPVPPSDEPGFDSGQEFGSGDQPLGFGTYGAAGSTSSAKKFFAIFTSFFKFWNNLDESVFMDFMNFLADPIMTNIGPIFKTIANFANLVATGGSWTRAFTSDALFKQALNVLSASTCGLLKGYNDYNCRLVGYLDSTFGKAFDWMHIGNAWGWQCHKKDIDCSTKIDNRFGGGSDGEFGSGLCDEVECVFFVEDLVDNFKALNNTCSFWVEDPAAIYNCMRLVTAYSAANVTSNSKADPATIAVEICFVTMAKNIESCINTGLPFNYDVAAAANEICSNTDLDVSFTECSCTNTRPLCDAGCCDIYANHVNLQTLAQIGNRTCAELYTYFPRDKIWCPLTQADTNVSVFSVFPDNTYPHMWCSYYDSVLNSLCPYVAPFTRIKDLNINYVLQDYKTTACNKTVNQVGVCLDYNTTIDSLAVEIMASDQNASTFIDTFLEIDGITYTQTPIDNVLSYSDDAATVLAKARDMHYCQQYSVIHKNDNIIAKSQPWRLNSIVSSFCDERVITAKTDIIIVSESVHKLTTPEGDALPVDLAGNPTTWSAFGSGAPVTDTGVCTGAVGESPEDLYEQQECMTGNYDDLYAYSQTNAEDTDALLSTFQAQEIYTQNFYSASGLTAIDPNDPEYEMKTSELERTDRIIEDNIRIEVTPYDEMRNVSGPWRVEYTDPPADTSLDYKNPAAAIPFMPAKAAGNSRTVLSISNYNNKPVAPDHYTPLKEIFKPYISQLPFMAPLTRKQLAARRKNELRIEKWGNELHETLFVRPRRDYDDPYDVDYFPNTRRLLMTGDAAVDASINEILDSFANVPHDPVGLTWEDFVVFLQNDIIAVLARATSRFITVVGPNIYDTMVAFLNANRPGGSTAFFTNASNTNVTFGGGTTEDKKCQATANDPYKGCFHGSNAYECCCPLIGCLPLIPDRMFMAVTTRETYTRWGCTAYRSLWGWWKWTIRTAISGFLSFALQVLGLYDKLKGDLDILLLSFDDLPPNAFNCTLVTGDNFFIGNFIIVAVFVFISAQVFTLLAMSSNRFREWTRETNRLEYNKLVADLHAIRMKNKNIALSSIRKI